MGISAPTSTNFYTSHVPQQMYSNPYEEHLRLQAHSFDNSTFNSQKNPYHREVVGGR